MDSEVKKELPNESEGFVGIDRNVKLILASGNDNDNVMKFCNQENMLQQLEQLLKELNLCEKAL